MKKLFTLSLLLSLLLSLPVFAHVDGGHLGVVPEITEELTVDGIKDGAYDDGLVIPIESQLNQDVVDATGVAYLVFRGDALYIYAEITDDDIVTPDPKIQPEKPWLTDSLEVFINEGNTDDDNRTMQYRIDCTGYPSAHNLTGLDAYTPDEAEGYFAYGQDIMDGGYTLEFRVPVSGAEVGFSLLLNDVTSDGKQTFAMAYSAATNKGPDVWGAYSYPFVTLGVPYESVPVTFPPAITLPPETDPPASGTVGTAEPDQSEPIVTLPPEEKGCGGTIGAAGMLVLAGAAWMMRKKKR